MNAAGRYRNTPASLRDWDLIILIYRKQHYQWYFIEITRDIYDRQLRIAKESKLKEPITSQKKYNPNSEAV